MRRICAPSMHLQYRAINALRSHRYVQVPLLTCRLLSTETSKIRFDDPKLAYGSKTTWEVLRSLLVLSYCKYDALVDRSGQAIALGRRILGRTLFNKLMRTTFYGQFVAGESDHEIASLVKRLTKYGASIILNYAVEDDEQNSQQKTSGVMIHEGQAEDPGDRNARCFIKTIDTVAQTTGGSGYTAIKVTALTRPEVLMAATDAIKASQSFLNQLLIRPNDQPALQSSAYHQSILHFLTNQGIHHDKAADWMASMEFKGDRMVDSINWSNVLNGRLSLQEICSFPIGEPNKVPDAVEEGFAKLVRRMDQIAQHAYEKKIRVLVDAEQTYFQPAIARISLELMRKYNRDFPTIFNTYQCYLKDAFKNLEPQLSVSQEENFIFGAKVVRGAYMHQERSRAVSHGYEDPINPDFEATTAMYKKVVGTLLEDIKARPGHSNIVIAGHNEPTVEWALSRLDELGIPRKTREVYFGQLFGMSDHISFTLANAGFNVVKCVPYGSIEEVLPYLVRRAQENQGFMEKTVRERRMLRRELWRRITRGDLFHNPNSLRDTIANSKVETT